jgi:hypothetical protein
MILISLNGINFFLYEMKVQKLNFYILLIFIPPVAPQSSSSIIWGLYSRPEVAAVPRDLVPPHQ